MADIIDVSQSGGGFRILFEDGSTRQCNRYGDCELLGHNDEFFVVEDYSYFLVLDPDGDVHGRIPRMAGEVTSVTGHSVVLRDGNLVKSYDMRGNQKSTRQVL